MKIIIIAAVAKNGVIGRSWRPCEACAGTGLIYGSSLCPKNGGCDGTGRVPCNELPWPPGTYPEDMAHFKAVTMGNAVCMGRNTWASIPEKFRPLPGRTNIVVSKTMFDKAALAGCGAQMIAESFDAVLHACRKVRPEKLYVIGGVRLFTEALPIADELDLTLIDREWEDPAGGAVRFPTTHLNLAVVDRIGWDRPDGEDQAIFECVSRERCPTNHDLTFTKWVRR